LELQVTFKRTTDAKPQEHINIFKPNSYCLFQTNVVSAPATGDESRQGTAGHIVRWGGNVFFFVNQFVEAVKVFNVP